MSSTAGLAAALEEVLAEFNSHTGTRRTSVWLHHRRARELYLFASSDAGHRKMGDRVPAGDSSHAAARGLRLEQALVFQEAPEAVLIAPLRGWRRALGTLVVEGAVSDELTNRERLDLASDLARQLSAGIENVQLLEEMLRQRRLLEDTFNSLVDLVVVTDREYRAVQVNDAFAMRVGRERIELLERPLHELVGQDLTEWATVGHGDPSVERARTREHHAFGGHFVVTVTPLIDEDGDQVGTVLVARDVTEQTRLEAERETLRSRLAQSEKLASLGQFVAGIAHEINNPLQGVLGHIELLLVAPAHQGTAAEKNRHLRRDLRLIYREADRAAKIVQNLLTFSGSQRKIRRRLRIERVISRALASRRRALARAGIDVVRDLKDDLATVIGDPMLLQQALLNVIINAEHAVAATTPPGTIVISTMTRDGRVVITVRDSGGGIATDALPRIFDPFFTTKTVGQGTGLGLAITYGIVQEHGGVIHATNMEDGGALLTIDLPAS